MLTSFHRDRGDKGNKGKYEGAVQKDQGEEGPGGKCQNQKDPNHINLLGEGLEAFCLNREGFKSFSNMAEGAGCVSKEREAVSITTANEETSSLSRGEINSVIEQVVGGGKCNSQGRFASSSSGTCPTGIDPGKGKTLIMVNKVSLPASGKGGEVGVRMTTTASCEGGLVRE